MVKVLSRISPRAFAHLLRQAAEAYKVQYHPVTPEPVLNVWLRREYRPGEWLRDTHHRRKGFRFLCQGTQAVGYLKFSRLETQVRVDKIWIQKRFRKRRNSAWLMKRLGAESLSISVYAGNVPALWAFRKLGFRYQGNGTFQALGFVQSGRVLVRAKDEIYSHNFE